MNSLIRSIVFVVHISFLSTSFAAETPNVVLVLTDDHIAYHLSLAI